MKQTLNYLFISTIVVITLMSCSKTKLESTSNSQTGDYIEFKIDGQLYRMNEQQIGPGNTDFITGAARQEATFGGKYALQIAFGHSTQDEAVGLAVADYAKITKPHYELTLADGEMFTYIMPNSNQYMTSSTSHGSIDFTSIDTTLNHTVEATFQMTGLELWDQDGNVISSGHTLTEGKIKTKIK